MLLPAPLVDVVELLEIESPLNDLRLAFRGLFIPAPEECAAEDDATSWDTDRDLK